MAETDEGARRVVERGEQPLRQPHPGETGRLATVGDPEGAVFAVVRSAR